jgi:hypothetical protein
MDHMNVKIHDMRGTRVAEMVSAGVVIRTPRDAADIVGEMMSAGLEKLILHERNVAPEFWRLETGLAGDVLQKISNCRIRVVFVGDFQKQKSKSLQAFIAESNRGNQVGFTETVESAMEKMSAG